MTVAERLQWVPFVEPSTETTAATQIVSSQTGVGTLATAINRPILNVLIVAQALGSLAAGVTYGSMINQSTDFGQSINFSLEGRAMQIQLVRPEAALLHRRTRRNRRINIPSQVQPVHIATLTRIKEITGLSDAEIAHLIGVSRQALYLWGKGSDISKSHLGRLLGLQDILSRAFQIYSTPEAMITWLNLPRGKDGITPLQLLKGGQFDRARMLAVSRPSLNLPNPPSWIYDPIPETDRANLERRPEAVPLDQDELFLRQFGNGENDLDDIE